MVVRKIKLFENWAEEIEVPEYLDPDWDPEEGDQFSIYDDIIKNFWKKDSIAFYTVRVNFKSFSDYDFWNEEYITIKLNQAGCKYKLEDCNGIPATQKLSLSNTSIKSFKGLENKVVNELEIIGSNLENLKYMPSVNGAELRIESSPLLSYFKLPTNHNVNLQSNFCGHYTWLKTASMDLSKFKDNDDFYTDPEIHGKIFCFFENRKYSGNSKLSNGLEINPWHNIYHDPNDVENFEFLFLPFYKESEHFRDKAVEYLGAVDLSGITRGKESLW